MADHRRLILLEILYKQQQEQSYFTAPQCLGDADTLSLICMEAWEREGAAELQVTWGVRMKCQGRRTNPEQTTRSEDRVLPSI